MFHPEEPKYYIRSVKTRKNGSEYLQMMTKEAIFFTLLVIKVEKRRGLEE